MADLLRGSKVEAVEIAFCVLKICISELLLKKAVEAQVYVLARLFCKQLKSEVQKPVPW
jgi:uncharacterized protein YejL (UPF0352 family)